MKIFHAFSKAFLLLLLNVLFITSVHSQNQYEKAWTALDEMDIDAAIGHFEAALKKKATKEDALLSLVLLYTRHNKIDKATALFTEYLNQTDDPYPVLYALWFYESVIGSTGKKKPFQLKRLKALAKDAQNIGKLDKGTAYRLYMHDIMSFDKKKSRQSVKAIKNIDNWLLLGPFDNVMNSGYDKDFGVLAHPETNAVFVSKYGADVSWFAAPPTHTDGYLFKYNHFLSRNSIVYAQTFVDATAENEVILKFGYSGSLKVWINDELLYREPERRSTEIDYYRFRCSLHKGYNRILIQLGDHEASSANFAMSVSDVNDNPIVLPQSKTMKPYTKKLNKAVAIPYFAIEALKKKAADKGNILYQILLAKAYMRSNEFNKAEAILKTAQKARPNNYFVLRTMILLYSELKDNTNQNKYYELFKKNYPEDIDILTNEINNYKGKENKKKAKELIATYLSKYHSKYKALAYAQVIAGMDQDNNRILSIIDSMYLLYPTDYTVLMTKYRTEKNYYSNPKKANEILEKYLEDNYNYSILTQLARNYLREGRMEENKKLLEKAIDLSGYSGSLYSNIVNLLTKQTKYREAIGLCEIMIAQKPSDYSTLSDLALLHKFIDNKEKAIFYYEESLRYFPFSFEVNEKIRELKGQKNILEFMPKIAPEDAIKDYEKNFKPSAKKPYDVVMDNKALIIFKSKAKGDIIRYVLRMNDESAIETWQNINLGADGNMSIIIDEVKTIKKNGDKLDADRSGNQAVFTNLEVGDYIYVSYMQKQTGGGKSSVFISDSHGFNSYNPSYKTEYNVFVEEGLQIVDTLLNFGLKPRISKADGFTQYQWKDKSPEILKEESYTIPFNDIAQKVHIAVDYTWRDIVQWYSDLSAHQAVADYTVKKIVKDLFEGKNLSNEEKAKVIYDFVCKNIQYSSIDFRQSGYIPQKAAKVYHSRLGDCKDVSTLFVSLARESGIKANLVLMNTGDNGQNDVMLPSLNFNHCIVKVYPEAESKGKYLELTDPNLPYGHLYYYHEGAAILEIPAGEIPANIGLTHLKVNDNYENIIIRKKTVNVQADYKMNIEEQATKTGTIAAGTSRNYYHSDEKKRKEDMKNAIARDFKSSVSLKALHYEILQPLQDTTQYTYAYVVDNDVLKLGSFRAFKIPFSDKLISMSIFDDKERTYEFNFAYYENADLYDETVDIILTEKSRLIEMPEDVHFSFKGTTYDLTFRKINDHKIIAHRIYKVNRKNIQVADFELFRVFMDKINEAENTHLLFK